MTAACPCLALVLLLATAGPVPASRTTSLRFEVTVPRGLVDRPRDGRLLIVLGRCKDPEPRHTIAAIGMRATPVLGRDVKGLGPGEIAVVDQSAAIFPVGHLSRLLPGTYFVQAVLDSNLDLHLVDAPGNLYSEVQPVFLDPARGRTVRIELSRRVPAEELPPESEYVKFVKLRSERLSRFHGRPIYLRAGIILPRDHDRERERHYPLRVHIGGYGTRFDDVRQLMALGSEFRQAWLAPDAPRMILLHLDGAGPYGDPYQVNSDNNGPYGDAVTQELIPYVEKRFRGMGRPHARVLDGPSTGGWVALALQVFYPDFFNGAWSHCPDPVDFRAYQLINIYADDNAYLNARGFERPSAREPSGDVRFTIRHECLLESVLGRGGRWTLSGRDWCAWNAAFGPRGEDGLPAPLWDGTTGAIDPNVLEHWQKYDLHRVLQRDWAILAPKLRGKVHIWVGEADDFFLNNAVHLLDQFLSEARPACGWQITFGMGKDHNWRGLSERQLLDEMAAAVEKGRRQAEEQDEP